MYDLVQSLNLKIVQKQFMCCVPIKDINWMVAGFLLDILRDISWENQEYLLDLTVKNRLVQKYPIKFSYQEAFIKHIISDLEKQCIDIHDELYAYCCSLMVRDGPDKEWFYKHYILDLKESRQVITLKESASFISEGTTGLCTWEAAFALAEWCVSNSDVIRDKTVFELGSGAGLLGLTVWKACNPRNLWLSDCHPSVITLLTQNVAENVLKSSAKRSCLLMDSDVTSDSTLAVADCEDCRAVKLLKSEQNDRQLGILELPWEEIVFSKRPLPDVILAADVVFDSTILPSLCEALNYLIGRDNQKRTAYISCTVRNRQTITEFLALLENFKLDVTEEKLLAPSVLHWCALTPIRIFKVQRSNQTAQKKV